jgi:type VI secretion system secreted protein VgrG
MSDIKKPTASPEPGAAAASQLRPTAYSLEIDTFPSLGLRVLRFTGEEGISKLFKFDVDVFTGQQDDLTTEKQFLGQRAMFTLDLARLVHGVVGRVTALGFTTKEGYPIFRIRIVPPLWLSKRKIGSRVFQGPRSPTSTPPPGWPTGSTVPEVVTSLLDEDASVYGTTTTSGVVVPRFQPWMFSPNPLVGTYARHDCCVQYQESEYAFIKRILAEAGVFWFFGYSRDFGMGNGDVMIIAESAAGYTPTAPTPYPSVTLRLPARALDNALAAPTDVSRFHFTHTVRPNEVLLKDYVFQKPLLDLRAEVTATGLDAAAPSDILHDPDRVIELRVYDHHAQYLEPDVTPERAQTELDQYRRRAFHGEGASTCPLLLPGYRFTLEADQTPSLAGDYVVTRIRHEGQNPLYAADPNVSAYRNEFSCVGATVPYRPKKPKPIVRQVLESALVTGPEDGMVYTDAFGRIRIQFQWDILGNKDENSTAWVRVVQGWAGPSFGWQFIPRVGMEVMVSFLGGDPDCPVVVGAIPNGTNPPPFHLPEQSTRSGLRTQSTPGGQGYNELSFEDASGSEQIFLYAQRDLDEEIRHNHTTNVAQSQLLRVGEDRNAHVEGSQDERIDGASKRVVGEDESIEVKGTRSTAIGGNDVTTVDNDRRVSVGAGEQIEIAGEATWKVCDDLTIRTEGCHTTIVGKADAKRSYLLHVEGRTDLWGKEITEIASQEGIRLRCGDSVVEVMPDRIEIVSPTVTLRTQKPGAFASLHDEKIQLYAKSKAQVSSEEVLLASTLDAPKGPPGHAALSLKGPTFQAFGGKIELKKPDDVDRPPDQPKEKPQTKIDLQDENGDPLKYQPIILVLDGGEERTLVLDEAGHVEVHDLDQVKGTVNIRFPGLIRASGGQS